MAKRSPDAVDRRVLALLVADARTSAAAIARKVSLSRAAVYQRIQRLERDGVILGYTTLVRSEPSTSAVSALITANVDAPRYAEIAGELSGWPEVQACWSIAGERDMALLVRVPTNDDLMEITRRLSEITAVRDTATMVILRTHFDKVGGSAS